MKSWIIRQAGGPEVLELRDVAADVAREGEVTVKVEAIGVNAADRYRRLGAMGPIEGEVTPGIEAIGTVIDAPSGSLPLGTRVATVMGGMQFDRRGAYAEQVTVLASNVTPLPPTSLSLGDLASIPELYLTAWGAVQRDLGIRGGETLVVRGASAALGLAATAFASNILGARVIAVVRNLDHADRVRQFGATDVVHDGEGWVDRVRAMVPDGADGVLDVVGGEGIAEATFIVRPFRKVVVVGLLAGPPVLDGVNLMADLAPATSVGFFPSQLLGTPSLPLADAPLAEIIEAVSDGRIPSLTTRVFGFDEVREVHELLEAPREPGKFVIVL